MTLSDFEENFHKALGELVGGKNSYNDYTFEVIADIREDRHYTSKDDFNLPVFRKHTEIPLIHTCEHLFLILKLFAEPEHLYPMNVELSLKKNTDKVICVKLDPRYRKFRDLKNQETGHPPFKVIR